MVRWWIASSHWPGGWDCKCPRLLYHSILCTDTHINKTLKYAAPPGHMHPALVPSNRVQGAEDYPDLGIAVRQRAVGHDAGDVIIVVELSGGEGEVGVEIVEGGQREGGGSPGGKGGGRGGVDADGQRHGGDGESFTWRDVALLYAWFKLILRRA